MAIATQGREDMNQWVTRYRLFFSMDKTHYVYYKQLGVTKVCSYFQYTLLQNGRHFSFKENILLNFEFKNEATRANLQVNKRILKGRPFWNKVHGVRVSVPNIPGLV